MFLALRQVSGISVLLFLLMTLDNVRSNMSLHRTGTCDNYTLITLDPPEQTKNYIVEHGIAFNFTVVVIVVPLTGDISIDFEYRFNTPMAILDMIWTTEMETGSYNTIYNDGTDSEEHLRPYSMAMRCYRRQLVASLSRRMNVPLIIFSDASDCPSAFISATKVRIPIPPAMVSQMPLSVADHEDTSSAANLMLQYSPSKRLFAKFVENLIQPAEDKWNGFAIIYDNLTDFSKYRSGLQSLKRSMYIRHWITGGDPRNAQMLRELQHLHTYLLDLSAENLSNFFEKAKGAEIVTSSRQFFINIQENLTPYLYPRLRANLTAIRWNVLSDRYLNTKSVRQPILKYSMTEQFVYSCIKTLSTAMLELGLPEPKPTSCPNSEQVRRRHKDGDFYGEEGNYAPRVFQRFKEILNDTYGLMEEAGTVAQINYKLQLLNVSRWPAQEIGTWDQDNKFIYRNGTVFNRTEIDLRGRHLRVVTAVVSEPIPTNVSLCQDEPFVIYSERPLYGSKKFSGFAIELLEELSEIHGFNYTLELVKDGKFGSLNETTGRWNGLIGELIEGRADMAVASLTISYDRERVIDFTTPFMSLSLSVIIRKTTAQTEFLQFLAPLSYDVWLTMIAAYVAVSLSLFIIGRISPAEWYQRHPCNAQIENQFTILNTFWFTVGSLMQQGCDIFPRATSTRIIGTIWWFFILIMVSSYTANLAAFLTIKRLHVDVENIEELSAQDAIKYGTLEGGSTYSFFKASEMPMYKRMWDSMNRNRSVFMNSTTDGIARVAQGDYAFILESTLNEYYTRRNCDLAMLGGHFDPRGYAIGVPIGNVLSETILKLQKEQKLEKMRQFWLATYNVTTPCFSQNSNTPMKRNKLDIRTMSGAFFVLALGLFMGFVVWLLEVGAWLYRIKATKRKQMFVELQNQLYRALLNCNTVADEGPEPVWVHSRDLYDADVHDSRMLTPSKLDHRGYLDADEVGELQAGSSTCEADEFSDSPSKMPRLFYREQAGPTDALRSSDERLCNHVSHKPTKLTTLHHPQVKLTNNLLPHALPQSKLKKSRKVTSL